MKERDIESGEKLEEDESELITTGTCLCNCRFLCNILLTAISFLAIFVFGVVGPIQGPTLQELSRYYGLIESSVSIIFLIKAFGQVLGSLFLGAVSDIAMNPNNLLSINMNKILFLAIFMTGVPSLLFPHVPWFPLACIIACFQGFGQASIMISTTLIIQILWSSRIVFPLIQALYLFYAVGAFLSPLFIGAIFSLQLSTKANLVIIYTTAGILTFTPALIIFLPSPKLKRIENESSPFYKNSEKITFKERIYSLLKNIDFLRIIFVSLGCLCMLFFVGADGTIQSLQFYYLIGENWNPSNASYMSSLYFGAYGFGRFCGIFVGIFLSPVQVFFIDQFGVIGTLTGMLILYSFKSEFLTSVGIFFLGMFCSTAAACFFTSPLSFGIQLTGFETSLLLCVASVGFIFPTITSKLMEECGNAFFLIIILIVAISSFVVWYTQFTIGTIYQYREKKKARSKRKSRKKNIL